MSMLTSGSRGQAGITGHQGIQITDWKEMVENKYNNHFTITNEYDSTDLSTKCIIIDTNSNKQYKFTSTPNLLTFTYMSNIMNETEQFIQGLIIKIRDEKITQVINGY